MKQAPMYPPWPPPHRTPGYHLAQQPAPAHRLARPLPCRHARRPPCTTARPLLTSLPGLHPTEQPSHCLAKEPGCSSAVHWASILWACRASAPQNSQTTARWPTRLLPHRPARPPPAHWPIGPSTGPPAHQSLSTTGGLQQHQMPPPNMPRRCRQTGLDAKGAIKNN
jgi:hypothetical protein